MSDPRNLSILILVACIIISRIIQVNAQNKLDAEKKSQLLDVSNKNQIAILVSIGVLFLSFFLVIETQIIDSNIAFIIYVILIFSISLVNIVRIYSKLKKSDFPVPFIQSYILSTIFRLGGLITFMILITK